MNFQNAQYYLFVSGFCLLYILYLYLSKYQIGLFQTPRRVLLRGLRHLRRNDPADHAKPVKVKIPWSPYTSTAPA